MKRKKSRIEVSQQVYLNTTDIMTLLKLDYYKAKRMYDAADRIDQEELSSFRIEPRKVRTETVCSLAQIDLRKLQRQIKG